MIMQVVVPLELLEGHDIWKRGLDFADCIEAVTLTS
jgi:hypothetical protein